MELSNAPIDLGIPVLGCALPLLQQPTAYLLKKYHELGPVFRLRIPNETLLVLAGIEANI